MKLANRTDELGIFRKLMSFPADLSILLIQAESGYGKSWLIESFEHHCPQNNHCVVLDLRGSTTGTVYFISQFQRELGVGYFPLFEALLKDFLPIDIKVSGNALLGQGNYLQVALNVEDINLRNLRFEQLQNKFFEDLRNLTKPIVLLIDTFQDAPKELQNWIEGSFLSEVVKLQNFVVVIAGQTVPP